MEDLKYGRYEYERSYLLENNALKRIKVIQTKKIIDQYFIGTHLRLRFVESSLGKKYKLTKKEKLVPAKEGVLKLNTLYLTKAEFEIFDQLEGYRIEKTRSIIEVDQIKIGIDRMIIKKQVVLIAEIEFETEIEMNLFSMPLDTIREITGEQEYNGFELAKKYSKHT